MEEVQRRMIVRVQAREEVHAKITYSLRDGKSTGESRPCTTLSGQIAFGDMVTNVSLKNMCFHDFTQNGGLQMAEQAGYLDDIQDIGHRACNHAFQSSRCGFKRADELLP